MDDILSPPLPSASAASTTWAREISVQMLLYVSLIDACIPGLEIHTTKWAATKEGLEYVKWVMYTSSTTHSFLESIFSILIIDLTLLWIT